MRRLVKSLGSTVGTILAGGLITATLIRLAPGFGIDPRESDIRLSAESRAALRSASSTGQHVIPYYVDYLRGLLAGDLGNSQSWGRPVAGLLRERAPLTGVAVAWGVAAGWATGLLLALLAVGCASGVPDLASGAICAVLLSMPSAVVALALLFGSSEARPVPIVAAALGLVVVPRVFRYARSILGQAVRSPHVLAARSRGVGRIRLVMVHVLVPSIGPVLAVAGVSVSMALGAAIPVEVVTGFPGLGQLAWQAAMQRDLPLLLNVALVVTAVAVVANSLADLMAGPANRDREAGV